MTIMDGKVDSTVSLVKTVGERIRSVRTAAGVTLVALSEQSGVARATLHQLEAGRGNPTLETLYAISNSLGVPLGDLLPPPGAGNATEVIRSGDGVRVTGTTLDVRHLQRVAEPGRQLDVYAMTIRPESRHTSQPHESGTLEYIHVHSGDLQVGTGEGHAQLSAGDFIRFDGGSPHSYEAGPNGCRVTLIISSPVHFRPNT